VRIDRDEWGLQLAEVTAKRGTCLRRQVGCVLTNVAGMVLATGYNGVASGQPHCNSAVPSLYLFADTRTREPLTTFPHACPGVGFPSGQGLDACRAIHAEANALLQCSDVYQIHTCYVTASPCVHCVKLLMNTGCGRIVFREVYPHPAAPDLWADTGGEWIHLMKET
jgi:dCMP deaminase